MGKQRCENTGPLTRERMKNVDAEFLKATEDFIDRSVKDDKPFFVWFNPTRMHIWTHVPQEYIQKAVDEGRPEIDVYRAGMIQHAEQVGIEVRPDGSAILLPVREAVGSSVSAVHLQTRSAWEVLQVFGAGIEIPPAHLEAKIVEPRASAVTEEMRFMTIRSSEKRPDDATVRIRFRDRWFYIDATDTRSKRAFGLLRTFIGMRLADPAAHKAPVLTVPVN